MTRVFNFSAGPAALPEPVLRQAADEMLDWHGSGMSVMEMSHRGKEFIAIHAEAEALLRELLAVPKNYKVLFMQGGAIGENAIVPMNMLRGHASADYVNTGEWSKKSIKEAKKYAKVNVAASSEADGFTSIPKRETWKLDPDAAYVHICSNETIGGVQYHFVPDVGNVPLIADMSSDIMSRPVDVSRFGLIYGGAQKNIGPAGLTIGRERLDAEHAADLRDLHRRPGVPLDQGARRAARDGGAQPREGCDPVRLPRDLVFLRQPGREGLPLADERAVQAEGRQARRDLPEGRAGPRHGAAQGPPLGRRHARVDLQRDAGRGRARARRVHERVRGAAWLRRRSPRGRSRSWC
jgi:hypothetical protein